MDDKTYLKSDEFALYCNSTEEFTIKGGHVGGIHNTGNLVIEETTNRIKKIKDIIKKITVSD